MHALLPVSALLVGVAILLAGYGLQGILLPVRADLAGFSTLEIATIASCYFGGFVLGCVTAPRLIRAVGHIRVFAAMTAVAAAVALGHGFLVLPLSWWMLRVISGVCFAVLFIVIESWLNARSTRESRGVVLSTYMVLNMTALTLGQMLLPLWDPRGMELFAVASILVSLAAVPVALTATTAPAPVEPARVRIAALFERSPAGVAACLAVGLANGAFWALGPQFARSSGLDDVGIAVFMSVAVLGGALGQWPLGRLSDIGDRRKVIVMSAALAAAAAVLLFTRPFSSELALFGAAVAWGAFAFPIYSLGVAHTNDHARPEEFVETSSGLLFVFAVGAISGPFLASITVGVLGPTMLYAFASAVHVVLLGFVLWRTTRTVAPSDEEQVDFAQSLQAATTLSLVFDEETQAELEAEHEDAEAARFAGSASPEDAGDPALRP